MPETISRTERIKTLEELARSGLSDAHVTDYDKINDDGDKIREKKVQGPQGTNQTFESNVTHIFQDTVSKTGDVELLRLEAELVDEGSDLANPHIPVSSDVLESALEQIESKGLTPAWEQ